MAVMPDDVQQLAAAALTLAEAADDDACRALHAAAIQLRPRDAWQVLVYAREVLRAEVLTSGGLVATIALGSLDGALVLAGEEQRKELIAARHLARSGVLGDTGDDEDDVLPLPAARSMTPA